MIHHAQPHARTALRTLLLALTTGMFPCMLRADIDTIKNIDVLASKMNETPRKQKDGGPKNIKFDFVDEDLIDIVNMLAARKNVNIILPTGANAITSKVTLHIPNLLDLHEAWDIMLSLLDLADYSLVAKDSTFYSIVKNSKAIGKEALPLFINVPPSELPDNDERIRYLFYLSNLKVSEDPQSMLFKLLTELLPDTAIFKVDVKTNALLISDKGNNVRSVMTIIKSLDQITFRETFDTVRLRYTSSDVIAKLFMETILMPEKDKAKYRLDNQKPSEASFFSRNVKLISEPRTNTLIILGREQAVSQIRDFIEKFIDVELETGKSILHVYQLQYLDAGALEPVLKSIVASALPGGTGQSSGKQSQYGPERFFEGVLIKADVGKEGSLSYGGNKIVVAAKSEDWKIIKQLIEELDKPQRTVIIEVLVADLTIQDQKLLGASLRNPAGLPFPGGNTSFQTIHITPRFINDVVPATGAATTLATDLLSQTFPGTTSFANTTTGTPPLPVVQGGSTLVEFNDNNGKTWGIAQILQILSNSKILSHPHVIATNNKPAKIKIGQWRLLQDQASAGTAATTITYTPQEANIEVNIVPRISGANTVNLNVRIDVSEFVGNTNNTRITRNIDTSALVQSEDILALGGLVRTDTTEGLSETPLLARIPIIGWFFKKRTSRQVKTNLTVFISPTIVEPRLRSGVDDYTKDYIKLTKKYAYEGELFDSLRDPITRFFFGTHDESQEVIDDFVQKDELKQDILHFNEAAPMLTKNEYTNAKDAAVLAQVDAHKAAEIKKLVATEENPLLKV